MSLGTSSKTKAFQVNKIISCQNSMLNPSGTRFRGCQWAWLNKTLKAICGYEQALSMDSSTYPDIFKLLYSIETHALKIMGRIFHRYTQFNNIFNRMILLLMPFIQANRGRFYNSSLIREQMTEKLSRRRTIARWSSRISREKSGKITNKFILISVWITIKQFEIACFS